MGRELLVVSLGPGRYGVPMEWVDQILEYREPPPLPGVPRGAEGVVDARGHPIPLVRLGARLGVAPCAPAAPAIVVIQLPGTTAGVVVDDVHEVIVVGFERCERPPRGIDHLAAVVRLDGRLLMILDLPALLGTQPSAGRPGALERPRAPLRTPGAEAAAPAVHPDCTGL